VLLVSLAVAEQRQLEFVAFEFAAIELVAKGCHLGTPIAMEYQMTSFLKSAAAACLFALAYATPALSWTKDCTQDRCGLSITALDQTSKKPMLTFTVLANKDKSAPGVIVMLPLGVALEPGVKLVVGDQQIAMAYKVCMPDGCQAYANISNDDWAKLLAAKSVEVRFFPLAADKPISSALDLSGLSNELSKL
jgi:invasion protein IalB